MKNLFSTRTVIVIAVGFIAQAAPQITKLVEGEGSQIEILMNLAVELATFIGVVYSRYLTGDTYTPKGFPGRNEIVDQSFPAFPTPPIDSFSQDEDPGLESGPRGGYR